MPKKLKDYYNKEFSTFIASKISKAYPSFDRQGFIKVTSGKIRGKEFLQRQDIYAEELSNYLPDSYARCIGIFKKILGPELKTDTGMFIHGWWLWPIGRFVEKRGLEDSELSLKFIYELTKRFTGEFAIRPILEAAPKKTLKVMQGWSKQDNVHVRRLSSEGIRISLPWAKKSTVLLNHFSEGIKILNALKHSPEKFVQKSVGNNINDLIKEDANKAYLIIDKWRKQRCTDATNWIIKHGLRNIS